jgi:DUF1680 family protein
MNSVLWADKRDYPFQPIPFTEVELHDEFWAPRETTNRKITVKSNFTKCEETGRLSNFTKAGGRAEGGFEGIYFNDSDVFKVIEGACYSLARHHDKQLEAFLDNLIDDIAAAQEEDGYLYTARSINDPKYNYPGKEARWSNLKSGHELYNVGHMYEAAAAHYQITGKRTLLNIALKNADLIANVFGPDPGQKIDVPGHEEIEIGLAKLYRVTGEIKYLDLAKFFIDMRGRSDKRELYGALVQDHQPVIEQDEAVGHAVRAGYLYSGVADVAALTGEQAYIDAIDRIWENVVTKKLYLTGGIGARHIGEAFGDNYELPNLTAYNETCAAISNAMWNHRMFLLHGHAKYMDIVERVIYNGFLSGVSLSGDQFFYTNPLAADRNYEFNLGSKRRQPWFRTSCCPVNVVRFIPSLTGYYYAICDNNLYVNLYASGTGKIKIAQGDLTVTQDTRYPWDGKVRIALDLKEKAEFTLCLRIPGWARNEVIYGDLYRFAKNYNEEIIIKVNGTKIDYLIQKGFASISRIWKKGDIIELVLPMPVRRVLCHPNVKENVDCIAVQRGPVVYCAEGIDNAGHVFNLLLNDDAEFTTFYNRNLLGGIITITAEGRSYSRLQNNSVIQEAQTIKLIPYYAWNHRGVGEMAVWLARDEAAVKPILTPTIASQSNVFASHFFGNDTGQALNDLVDPANSNDHSIPRFTWWDHKGTIEWVQYDLKETQKISAVEVYWFDDEPRGGKCRVPSSWRVMYKHMSTGNWKPVVDASDYTVNKDAFNKVSFNPVLTSALRLEVQLKPDYSAGILEWRINKESEL